MPAAELEQIVFQTLKKQMELFLHGEADEPIQMGVYVAEQSEYERQIESLYDSKRLFSPFYFYDESACFRRLNADCCR